jgi:hypothetical protein
MVFTSARDKPRMINHDFDPLKIADKEEIVAQKLHVENMKMPIGMSLTGGSLLTLAAMLGVLVRRALQPAATFPSSSENVFDMSVPMTQTSADNVLELKARRECVIPVEKDVLKNSGNTPGRDNFRSRGWLQPSLQYAKLLTVCYSARAGAEDAMADVQNAGRSLGSLMPAGISSPLGLFDPLGLAEDGPGLPPRMERVRFYRECELKHGRVAMLAAIGFPVAEQFHPLFGGNIDVPSSIAFQATPLQTFWPLVVLVLGILEIFSVFGFEDPLDEEGRWWTLKRDRMPGDFGFDPLNMYSRMFPAEQIEMRTKELNNGRLAMIGITGMVVQELATGTTLF